MYKYNDLNKAARRQIQEQFIKRACIFKGLVEVEPDELDRLVNNKLNGWQVSQQLST